jgi:hypothetical protein
MPFALLIVGILFLVAAVRGTHKELFALLGETFGGKPGFLKWALALVLIGAIGYVKSLKPVSNAMLTLVFLALILANRGFFKEFTRQIDAA